jgi:exo-poly-alpha-galacturonosidase
VLLLAKIDFRWSLTVWGRYSELVGDLSGRQALCDAFGDPSLLGGEAVYVTPAGVRLETGGINNADGIDFNQGTGLGVYDNVFDTGDDDLNFAAGLGQASAADPPTRDAWISGNYYRTGHGAVVAGSHTGSWIEDLVAENNVIDRTDVALRMKTDPHNGGGARRILFQHNAVRAVAKQAFIFTSTYADPSAAIVVEPAGTLAHFTDVTIRHVTVDGTGDHAIEVTGVPGVPHTNLRFDDVHFLRAKPTSISYLEHATFHDVVFDQTPDPWTISESAALSFTGATTATADAAVSPQWTDSPRATATDTTATLTWQAATDNVAVPRYRILQNGTPIATITGTTYQATGLSPILTYRFAIQAGDGLGDWTTSPTVTVHTTSTPDTIPPTGTPCTFTIRAVNATGNTTAYPGNHDHHHKIAIRHRRPNLAVPREDHGHPPPRPPSR